MWKVIVVQSLSFVQLFATPWTVWRTLSSSVLHCLPKFAQTHVHWVSDAIQPSYPQLPSSPLALNLSQHQGLFNESANSIRWPNYRSFSFDVSPSKEGLRVEKYYKPIRAPYYIAKCVSWVPRLTLLDFTNKLDLWMHSQNGTRMYKENLLYCALVSSSMKWGEKYRQ